MAVARPREALTYADHGALVPKAVGRVDATSIGMQKHIRSTTLFKSCYQRINLFHQLGHSLNNSSLL